MLTAFLLLLLALNILYALIVVCDAVLANRKAWQEWRRAVHDDQPPTTTKGAS